MRNGLYAVTLTQGSSTVLRVGWFRRDAADPDEYEVTWTTPYRDGYATLPSDVWAGGPGKAPGWKWGPVLPSVAHRFHIQPLARLNEKHWAKICPRPDGWSED